MTWSLPSAAGQRPAAAYTLRTHSTGARSQRSTVPPTVSGAKNRVTPPDQRLHGRPGRDNHRMAAVLQYADPTPTPQASMNVNDGSRATAAVVAVVCADCQAGSVGGWLS